LSSIKHVGPTLGRKAEQQTRLVTRAVTTALDADLYDPRLDATWLEHVFPINGGFQLLFLTEDDVQHTRAALEGASAVLRAAVARLSSRKRVPRLFIEVLPASAFIER
jgi:ribosome-binding factor A